MAEAINENRDAVLATITTNAAGGFLSVSPQFLELIGRPVEALAGVNLSDLVHPLQAAAVRALLAAQSADQVTTRLLGSDDRWIPVVLDIGMVNDGRITVRLHSVSATATTSAEPAPAVPAPVILAPGATATDAVPTADTPQPTPGEPTPGELSSELQPAMTQLQAAPVGTVSAPAFSASNDHTAYVRSMPTDEIPELRDAARKSVGDAATPMLEIDVDGRTTFVQGPWAELSTTDAVGADVFEELLANSARADDILDGLTSVFETGQPGDFEIAVAGLPPRWVRLAPIPSPHLAGKRHALVAVVAESALRRSGSAQASGAGSSASVAAVPDAEVTEGASEVGPATPPDPPGRRRLLAVLAALAAVLVVWGVYSAISGSEPVASPFIRVAVPEPEPEPEPVSTELQPTEAIQVNDAQTWRSIGAVDLDELHAVAGTPTGGFVADVAGRLIRLDDQAAAVGVSSVSGGTSTFISDIASDTAGGVWILDAGLGRISKADSGGNVIDIEAESGPLLNARGVGAGADNTVWVASTAAAQLTQLSADGAVVSVIALPGRQPSDVAQANDGSFWVIDAEQLEVLHLTETGELITASPIGFFGSLESPHLVLVGDVLWVTEPESSAVFAVDTTTGEATDDRFELAGAEGAQVLKPIGIGAGLNGQLWIVDSLGGGIIALDT